MKVHYENILEKIRYRPASFRLSAANYLAHNILESKNNLTSLNETNMRMIIQLEEQY